MVFNDTIGPALAEDPKITSTRGHLASEPSFIALIDQLTIQTNRFDATFQTRSIALGIHHLLTSHDLQERLNHSSGPEAARLQSTYAKLKTRAIKESVRAVHEVMKTLTDPQEYDLTPSLRACSEWLENHPRVSQSFQEFFAQELKEGFAKFLFFHKKTNTNDGFSSNALVQTVLHVQQKFFMIDYLANHEELSLTLKESYKLKALLILSLQENLNDFLKALEFKN